MRKIVDKILNESDEKNLGLSVFKNFTTYFSPFMENRKNIFSSEEKSTSLAYRAININFNDFYTIKKFLRTLLVKILNSQKVFQNTYVYMVL